MTLDGEGVPLSDFFVDANLHIASADMSGNSSASTQRDDGFKPIVLNCTGLIEYKDAAELRRLVDMARALGSSGTRRIYRISNRTARALGVLQVKFTDNFNAKEDDSLHIWRVSFSLTEHMSVPEKVEQRVKSVKSAAAAAISQAATGSSGNNTNSSAADAPALSNFETILKNLDDALS